MFLGNKETTKVPPWELLTDRGTNFPSNIIDIQSGGPKIKPYGTLTRPALQVESRATYCSHPLHIHGIMI